MSTETWGNMPKSQDDPQKPNEAINASIDDHNNDPEAHLGANQSLQSHRASEIIDHIARSIVGDKVNALEDAYESDEQLTITSLTSTTITDTSKDWEVDQWAGHWILNANNETGESAIQIVSNTADTLTLTDDPSSWYSVDDIGLITNLLTNDYWDWTIKAFFPANGRQMYSSTSGRYIEAVVHCNQLAILFAKLPSGGKVDISIDGSVVATLDLYSAQSQGRVRAYETTFDTVDDHTVRVTVRSDHNGSSSGHDVYFQAFDVNGVVSFSALDTCVLAASVSITTNSAGYGTANCSVPEGFYLIAPVGCKPDGLNSGSLAAPSIYWDFDTDPFQMIIDNATASHAYTIKVWYLCARDDSRFDQ